MPKTNKPTELPNVIILDYDLYQVLCQYPNWQQLVNDVLRDKLGMVRDPEQK